MSFLIREFCHWQLRANTPWYRKGLCRGLGASAASLSIKSRVENKMLLLSLIPWLSTDALTFFPASLYSRAPRIADNKVNVFKTQHGNPPSV